MASNHVRTVGPRAERVPICSPEPPPCPLCGALECLCRPRWVAGQLVSEADLNRLDRYITGKQRLHNRHLFGTGVVCGLVVHCHPCEGGLVRVTPGYALGPCGEDIVVCAPDTVDVCALVQTCKAREYEDLDCRPFGDDRGCQDLDEEWVLAIRYEEYPARTEPRVKANPCPSCGCAGSGCSCGGGSHSGYGAKAGGCGCGGPGERPLPRTAPVECAPTITCEGYRYEVFRAPKPVRDDDRRQRGPLFDRYLECIEDLLAAFREWQAGGTSDDLDTRIRACTRLKAALVAHFSEHATSQCEAVRQLCTIACSPEPDETANQRLLALVLAAVQDCLCHALLPPCPEPTSEPRLPLATITVRGAPCRVMKVCNWTPLRPIVLTFPNLSYWLSLFPQIGTVRDLLHRLCCEPLLQRPGVAPLQPFFAAAPGEAAAEPRPEADLFTRWLIDLKPDPRDLLGALRLTATPDEVETLRQEVAELRAEVARLRPQG